MRILSILLILSTALFSPCLCNALRFKFHKPLSKITLTGVKPVLVGIQGTCLSAKERELFQKHRPFGAVLFGHNIKTPKELKSLTWELSHLYGDRPFHIFTDQEGGSVQRLKTLGQTFASAQALGDSYEKEPLNTKKEVYQSYEKIQQLCNAYGIVSPLAPVCDVATKGTSFMATRSFGSTPEQVIDLASQACQAIIDQKGIAVLKHAPGHGGTSADSHVTLPVVMEPWSHFSQKEARVFSTLLGGHFLGDTCSNAHQIPNMWVMLSHILYTSLDRHYPASLSKKVMARLRKEWGFKGVFISDALDMMALHLWLCPGVDEKELRKPEMFRKNLCVLAKKALDAGCNIVIVGRQDYDTYKAILENIPTSLALA